MVTEKSVGPRRQSGSGGQQPDRPRPRPASVTRCCCCCSGTKQLSFWGRPSSPPSPPQGPNCVAHQTDIQPPIFQLPGRS